MTSTFDLAARVLMRYRFVPRVATCGQPTWQRYDVLEIWLSGTDIDIDLFRFSVDGCFEF